MILVHGVFGSVLLKDFRLSKTGHPLGRSESDRVKVSPVSSSNFIAGSGATWATLHGSTF